MNCTCTMYIKYTWLSLQVCHQLMKDCVASVVAVCVQEYTDSLLELMWSSVTCHKLSELCHSPPFSRQITRLLTTNEQEMNRRNS